MHAAGPASADPAATADMIKLTPVSVRQDYDFVMTPEEGIADLF